MSDITLILLAAGSSSRFDLNVKKQWLRIEHTPLWQFVAQNMQENINFHNIIITAAPNELEFMSNYADYHFVAGGNSRQESLNNALQQVITPYVLVSDIARACIGKDLLEEIINCKNDADSIVPYLPLTDTIVYEDKTIDRTKVKRIQTPQLSKTDILKKALQTDQEFTDESSAIAAINGSRKFILGEDAAHKITYIRDLQKLPCLKKPSNDILSGNGFDVHQFQIGGQMYLGGVAIESELSFKAHSDGDVAIHALIDALLGAAGMGDIGMLFPDNDDTYKGIDSKKLLSEVVKKIYSFGFIIINADITIAAQKPRIGHYKNSIREVLASLLHIDKSRCNVKATTTEKLGFIGRGEGVGVMANVNLKYFDWTKV